MILVRLEPPKNPQSHIGHKPDHDEIHDSIKLARMVLRTLNIGSHVLASGENFSSNEAMAKKRTKTDKLQRNVEQLATCDGAVREKSEINDKRSEPTSKTPDPTEREAEAEILSSKKTAIGTQRKATAA